MASSELNGAWRLVEWVTEVDGEPRLSFLGPKAEGLLIYSGAGYMSATLAAPGRPLLGSNGFKPGPTEKKLEAADGYISYSGRFRVEGDQVHHDILQSLYPDWIGQTLTRKIRWQDGDLMLETPAQKNAGGKTIVDRIRWQRLSENWIP